MFASTSFGQVHKHTIGARFGYGYYLGPEFSFHLGLSDHHRFELDAGYLYSNGGFSGKPAHARLAATVAFHWDYNLFDGLNWFVGPAVQLGPYMYFNGVDPSYFYVAVGAQVGLEYDFSNRFRNVPLVVGLDHRPMIDVIRFSNWQYDGHIAASVRYILND